MKEINIKLKKDEMFFPGAPAPMVDPICSKCGSKKVLKQAGGFNGKTGKKYVYMVCMNLPTCPVACFENYGSHDYGFLGLGSRCKRCGDPTPA